MTNIATPPDLTPEQQATLDRVLKGEALCRVNTLRIEQITKFGHTDEADANEPVNRLPKFAREEINAALEDLMMPRETGIPLAYKRMAKAAAMLLAGMDRIQPELDRLQRARPSTPDLFAEKDPA
ncbi:hypothetical protein [Sphingorhabdus sp.]|jgi:hypothetical protein|uniref:hypothetical protein n=1 Tax=Sphingorhabdus sp. TaxID=1902408 RepID=UPI0037C641B1